jgi:hypothetical protein
MRKRRKKSPKVEKHHHTKTTDRGNKEERVHTCTNQQRRVNPR